MSPSKRVLDGRKIKLVAKNMGGLHLIVQDPSWHLSSGAMSLST